MSHCATGCPPHTPWMNALLVLLALLAPALALPGLLLLARFERAALAPPPGSGLPPTFVTQPEARTGR